MEGGECQVENKQTKKNRRKGQLLIDPEGQPIHPLFLRHSSFTSAITGILQIRFALGGLPSWQTKNEPKR